jgi:hypothetical protein
MSTVIKVLLTAAFIALILIACNEVESGINTADEKRGAADHTSVARGQYLVTIMGCGDCHSPKVMGPKGPQEDPQRLLSGHPSSEVVSVSDTSVLRQWVLFNFNGTAVVGPWGVSFAANITSDSTGIGAWREEQFITAMREGKYKGLKNNRTLLPPMPWPNYAKASDADLKAIFRYLKSTKPVNNVVPAALTSNQP